MEINSRSLSTILSLVLLASLSVRQPACAQTASDSSAKPEEESLAVAMKLRQERKYEEAMKLYKEIITRSPDNAIAHQELGAVYASLDKYNDAIAEENKAIKLDESLHLPHIYKGMIYCNKRRNLDAYSEFQKAYRLRPNSYVVHMRLGVVCTRLRRYEEAAREFKSAATVKPMRAAPHMELSDLYIEQGEIDEAVREAELAVKLQPIAKSLTGLGKIFTVSNRLAEAQALLVKAISQQPDHVDSHVALGRVYTLKGEYDKARQSYKEALQLSPRNREAMRQFAMLCNDSILRVRTATSSTGWLEEKRGYRPVLKLQIVNVSGQDLTERDIQLRARFQNVKSGSKAVARLSFKKPFKDGQCLDLELKPRKLFKLPEDKSKWPRFQCTVMCRVGNVSDYSSQYILDTLMTKP